MSPPPPKAPSGGRSERQPHQAAAIHTHTNACFAEQVEWNMQTNDLPRPGPQSCVWTSPPRLRVMRSGRSQWTTLRI